jgi:dolichol kinase
MSVISRLRRSSRRRRRKAQARRTKKLDPTRPRAYLSPPVAADVFRARPARPVSPRRHRPHPDTNNPTEQPVLSSSYWAFEVVKIGSLFGIAYLCGLLVQRANVRVNYTRKINHFALFFLPMYLSRHFDFTPGLDTTFLTGGLLVASLGLYVRPLRERSATLTTMFASFDRPEDRPHTLWWLQSQIVAGYLVLVPLAIVFTGLGHASLTLIPILINGIGDGLAEPVGVRFGRHTYSVRALHGGRRYTRSLEGSACVLITGFIVIALFHGHFTTPQFRAALLTVPLFMTLAEAFSPHTWDTPFLFLVGGGTLLGIVTLL